MMGGDRENRRTNVTKNWNNSTIKAYVRIMKSLKDYIFRLLGGLNYKVIIIVYY